MNVPITVHLFDLTRNPKRRILPHLPTRLTLAASAMMRAMAPARIEGINHVTLSAPDVEEAIVFYRDVLGCDLVAAWPSGAYLLAGTMWLALVQGNVLAGTDDYSHIVFTVSSEDLAGVAARVEESGAVVWQDNRTEGDSLYFEDPAGHRLEIHSSDLSARLRSALEHPWEGLTVLRPDLAET